ncbi:MAG: ATP-binding protein, partial [Burkholderiales bacterium]|nr:ATP-binding protein [Burkholderiales bacterium]
LEVADDARGVDIDADPDALQSMVDNVIDNAIRYTPAGGHVTVAVTRPAPDRLGVDVVDDGPGLDAEGRARAFDRFWRGDAHEQPGSGLGLAIVDQVVRRHGGDVRLDPAPIGTGLAVRITLPARGVGA